MKKQKINSISPLLVFWGVLVSISLVSRPLLPIDETRYLGVAWEMWRTNEFWVPHFQGHFYSHKPPLLFWLIHLGWKVFGAHEWWARLVSPLFGLGSIFLTIKASQFLWPHRKGNSLLVGFILIGFLPFQIYGTLTLFDNLIMFFSVLGFISVILIIKEKRLFGWIMLCCSIGLGLLAKGPVIFLYTLPLPIILPLINTIPYKSNYYWYRNFLISLLAGCFIALIWAIPAVIKGGPDYAQAIFWKQTAGRIVNSFAHARPFWWYFFLLPVFLFPWYLFPSIWRGIKKVINRDDLGVKLCLIWILIPFFILMLISGKQLHYLVPLLPGAVLLVYKGLLNSNFNEKIIDKGFPVILLFFLGGIFIFSTYFFNSFLSPQKLQFVFLIIGTFIFLTTFLLVSAKTNQSLPIAFSISLASVLFIIISNIGVSKFLKDNYDLTNKALKIKFFQDKNLPVAFVGTYHGEVNFLGRLITPIIPLSERNIGDWSREHPQGKVVFNCKTPISKLPTKPNFYQKYKLGEATIWDAKTLMEFSEIWDLCQKKPEKLKKLKRLLDLNTLKQKIGAFF